jgi:DNA repair protein RecO (recombination protein O)
MSRVLATEAVVFGSHKLGESDRVVTLFTSDFGRLPTVVKGVRKVKSRFGGRLEPLSRIEARLYRGRSLFTLTGADTISTNSRIRDCPPALKAGLAFIDMVNRTVPEGERRPRTYNPPPPPPPPPPASFSALALAAEMKLLLLAGYLPHLSHCARCGREGAYSRFSAPAGGCVCGECSGEALEVRKETVELMWLMLEQPLAGASSLEPPPEALSQVWLCIRELCRFHQGIDLRLKP